MSKNQGLGSVRDLPKKENTDAAESLRLALIQHGLNPDRIVVFIDTNLDKNKEAAEARREALGKMEYARAQLIFNDVQILRLLIGD